MRPGDAVPATFKVGLGQDYFAIAVANRVRCFIVLFLAAAWAAFTVCFGKIGVCLIRFRERATR
jgi:hypothetical protein